MMVKEMMNNALNNNTEEKERLLLLLVERLTCIKAVRSVISLICFNSLAGLPTI